MKYTVKELPDIIQAINETGDSTQLIPKLIFQTACTNEVTSGKEEQVKKMMEDNPEYAYFFYTDVDARDMIKTYFDKDVLKAYDKLIPGAFKADLFRYCCLYLNGGVYLDMNKSFVVPITEFVKPNLTFISCIDQFNFFSYKLFQAILATTPKHPVMKMCIDKIVENVENNYYGSTSLDITGPGLIGTCFKEYYKITPLSPTEFNDVLLFQLTQNGSVVVDSLNKPIVVQDYKLRAELNALWKQKCHPTEHYHDLYSRGTVYKDEQPLFLSISMIEGIWKLIALLWFCIYFFLIRNK